MLTLRGSRLDSIRLLARLSHSQVASDHRIRRREGRGVDCSRALDVCPQCTIATKCVVFLLVLLHARIQALFRAHLDDLLHPSPPPLPLVRPDSEALDLVAVRGRASTLVRATKLHSTTEDLPLYIRLRKQQSRDECKLRHHPKHH